MDSNPWPAGEDAIALKRGGTNQKNHFTQKLFLQLNFFFGQRTDQNLKTKLCHHSRHSKNLGLGKTNTNFSRQRIQERWNKLAFSISMSSSNGGTKSWATSLKISTDKHLNRAPRRRLCLRRRRRRRLLLRVRWRWRWRRGTKALVNNYKRWVGYKSPHIYLP